MEFLVLLLELLVNSEDEMKACAEQAYEKTLRNYHGFATRQIFKLAMKTVGKRENFLKKFGEDIAGTTATLKAFVDTFKPSLQAVVDLLQKTGLEDGSTA
uniref:Glycolipid transfer protein domain-containing protein n=2 Tax=Palpitomonas bilix TaxID=652834 RepID=A0A7S3G5B4_9EUKA|mmetsp:Transcript_30409/g.78657  ORF Transcript_30409/g.78657 Transcript_30409/m.78657 type:complete len:100 (+) Transcript_30409:437-736(+)